MLIKILSCIQFLATQGLPLRGHGDDSDGNLLQPLKYQGGKEIKHWLQRKTNKYQCRLRRVGQVGHGPPNNS